MHQLKRQILALQSFDEESAPDLQNRARTSFYHQLSPEMESILNACHDENTLLRIDRLILDLGTVSETHFEQEWTERFKTAFEQALKDRIHKIRHYGGNQHESETRLEADHLERFRRFLHTGHLDWYGLTTSFDQFVHQLMESQPDDFKQLVLKEGKRPTYLRRIAYQFSPSLLHELTRLLEPQEATLIIQTAEEIRSVQREEAQWTEQAESVHTGIWEMVLTYLVQDRGSKFNALHFLRYVVDRTARHFNKDFHWLLELLHQGMDRQPITVEQSTFLELLDTLYVSEIQSTAPIGELIGLRFERQVMDLQLYLERGAIPDTGLLQDTFRPKSLWAEWLNQHGIDVQVFLIGQANNEALRWRIIAISNEAQLKQVFRILVPSGHDQIFEMREYLFDQQRQHQWVNQDHRTFDEQLWYVLYTAIIEDRGSQFNRKNFVIATLNQFAAHHNININYLFRLISLYTGKELFNDKYTSLISLLQEIVTEWQQSLQSTDLTRDSSMIIPEHALSQFITHFVLKHRPPNDSMLEEIGVDLASATTLDDVWKIALQSHPEWLKKWLTDPVNRQRMMLAWPDELNPNTLKATFTLLHPGMGHWLFDLSRQLVDMKLDHPEVFTSTSGFQSIPGSLIHLLSSPLLSNDKRELIAALMRIWISPEAEAQKLALRAISNLNCDIPVEPLDEPGYSVQIFDQEASTMLPEAIKNQWNTFIRKHNSGITTIAVHQWLMTQLNAHPSISDTALYHLVNRIYKSFPEILKLWTEPGGIAFRLYPYLIKAFAPYVPGFKKDLSLLLAESPSFSTTTFDTWWASALLELMLKQGKIDPKALGHYTVQYWAGIDQVSPQALAREWLDALNEKKREPESRLGLELARIANPVAGVMDKADEIKAPPAPKATQNKAEEADQTIYVHNAGVVILWPFLSTFFQHLNLIEGHGFIDEDAAGRAPHLLQYLVNGQTGLPEYELFLPKLLCGLEDDQPLHRKIQLTEEEVSMSESLVNGVIEQWNSLKNTSPKGLQESFLQREGVLEYQNNQWTLRVESKSHDLLLDRMPWSVNNIKLPWMKAPLYVKWR